MGPGAASITGLRLAPARSSEGAVPGIGLEAGLTSTGTAVASVSGLPLASAETEVDLALEEPPAWQAGSGIDLTRPGGDADLAGAGRGTDLAGAGVGADLVGVDCAGAGMVGAGAGTVSTGAVTISAGAGMGCVGA